MPLQHIMTCQILGFFRIFQQDFCPFGKVLCQACIRGQAWPGPGCLLSYPKYIHILADQLTLSQSEGADYAD